MGEFAVRICQQNAARGLGQTEGEDTVLQLVRELAYHHVSRRIDTLPLR